MPLEKDKLYLVLQETCDMYGYTSVEDTYIVAYPVFNADGCLERWRGQNGSYYRYTEDYDTVIGPVEELLHQHALRYTKKT